MSRSFGLAKYKLNVEYQGQSKSLEIYAQQAPSGWNNLGLFDLEAGKVDVVLTPQSIEQRVNIGDAIKWTLEQVEN